MSAEEKVYTFAVKRKQLNINNLIIMITNYDTNIVYFAEGLKHVKYVDMTSRVVEHLHHNRMAWGFLGSSDKCIVNQQINE